jgi:hypothetical protein
MAADVAAMPAGDAEPIPEPLIEPDEFFAQQEEACQIESAEGVQFETSGDNQAGPSHIDIWQGARGYEEADANVAALVPPVSEIEMPLSDQREQEPILPQGMIYEGAPDHPDAARCSQDEVSGDAVILHRNMPPLDSYRERTEVVTDQPDIPVPHDSSQQAVPAGGQAVAGQFDPEPSIGNGGQAVMGFEHQEVIEVEQPHDTDCYDGGHDAEEEMEREMSRVLPWQIPYPSDRFTDFSDDADTESVLDNPQSPGAAENRGDEPEYVVSQNYDICTPRIVDATQLIDDNLPPRARHSLDFLDDDSLSSIKIETEDPQGQRKFLDSDDSDEPLDAEMPIGPPIRKFLESTTDDANDESETDDRRPKLQFLSDSDLDPELDSPQPNPDRSPENRRPGVINFLSDSDIEIEVDTAQPDVPVISHRQSFLSDDGDPCSWDLGQ